MAGGKMTDSREMYDSLHRSYRPSMSATLSWLFADEGGQDIAEYAVMLAVILVIVVGTIRLIGSNANNVFSSVASSIQ
jgi:Flp pilus assembly pilin Flp